jgi:hypothetical protein
MDKKINLLHKIWNDKQFRDNFFPELKFLKHTQINSVKQFNKLILPRVQNIINSQIYPKNQIKKAFSLRHTYEYAFNCKINLSEPTHFFKISIYNEINK